jgi:hypothetical protein
VVFGITSNTSSCLSLRCLLFTAPMQRLFGVVARRTSSAIYTPGQRNKPSTPAAAATAVVTAFSSASDSSAVEKARFTNRAAAVKKFIGGAAIAGVPRTLATAYTEREDIVPITEGKFGKAFDLQLVSALLNPQPDSTTLDEEPEEAFSSGAEDESSDREGLEMWEIKTKEKRHASKKKSIDTAVDGAPSRKASAAQLKALADPSVPVKSAPLMPTKSALRNLSASPTATRRSTHSGGAVHFDERRSSEPPQPPSSPTIMRTRTASTTNTGGPEILFFDERSLPKEENAEPRVPAVGSKGYHEAKASGVFLNKYCSDEDEGTESDTDTDAAEGDVRALHNEDGELSSSFIRAVVEDMFAQHNYVSPLKGPSAVVRPPPPPPPPPGRASIAVVDAEGFERDGYPDNELPAEGDTAGESGFHLTGGDGSDVIHEAIREEVAVTPPPETTDEEDLPAAAAQEAPTTPLSLRDRIAALNLTGQAEATKPNFTIPKKSAADAPASPSAAAQESPGVPLPQSVSAAPSANRSAAGYSAKSKVASPPQPSVPQSDSSTKKVLSVTKSPLKAPVAPPNLVPLPVICELEANISTKEILSDTARVLSTSVTRIKSLANARNLKIPTNAPLVSDLVHAKIAKDAINIEGQLSGHGKLDAFEQLMMERKSVAEALIKMQDLEEASLQRIKEAETASLQRIQHEATHSMGQVNHAEQRLLAKTDAHVTVVKQNRTVLTDKRRDLYLRQAAMQKLEQQRFEEIAEVATTLAEQQLYVVADRRRMTEKQFQLQLAITDLHQITHSGSRAPSPSHRSVASIPSFSFSRDAQRSHSPPDVYSPPRFSPTRLSSVQPYSAHNWQHQNLGLPSPPRPPSISPPPPPPPDSPAGDRHSVHFPPPPDHSPESAVAAASTMGTSVDASAKTTSPEFDRITPVWHSPVVPLGARRASVTGGPLQQSLAHSVAMSGEVVHRVPGHLIQNADRQGQDNSRKRAFR